MPFVNKAPREVSSLVELSTRTLSDHAKYLTALSAVPEHLVLQIFEALYLKGKLTPRIVAEFRASGHQGIDAALKALKINPEPPVCAYSCEHGHLGARPHLF
eukprot:TRINITY_DN1038_c3_g1_i1.p4 TRINITY_DN1038_c3_g1~~TRINITY_DN1038_c3_g1_i1.p4  ORF type:complete len:102 (-),score=13.39 TRINITY_DN1038_c3_g1_i1:366-671(-)